MPEKCHAMATFHDAKPARTPGEAFEVRPGPVRPDDIDKLEPVQIEQL